ncbi:hypothetical protein F8O53_00205 [Enterobacter sp. 63]
MSMYEIECPQTGEVYDVDPNNFIDDSGDYCFETPEGLRFIATLEVDDDGNITSIIDYSENVGADIDTNCWL